MKKIAIIALVCLLLSACGTNGVENGPTETTGPVDTGLYIPNSAVEQQTKGAVRIYALDEISCTGLFSIGNKLLLVGDGREMILLDGELCRVVAELKSEKKLFDSNAAFSIADTGIAYYDGDTNQVIRLNPQLQKSAEYSLPEDMVGTPAVSLGTQEIYYRTEQELRAINMHTGISRLLWRFGSGELEIAGVFFEGKVLGCRFADDTGVSKNLYLSTQTGQTLSDDQMLFGLQTWENTYFAQRQDGQVTQRIFGAMDGEAKSLNLDAETGKLVAALPQNGVVSYVAGEDGLQMKFYDLKSGRHTAAVKLMEVEDPQIWHSDGEYLWVVAYQNEKQVLCRWDMTRSPAQDETVYTGPLYTAQSPDTAGLAVLQQRVNSMNQKYGVQIAIWQNTLTRTGGYTLVGEHQLQPISQMLDKLEQALSLFPAGILKQTVKAGDIRIGLVRSIEGEDYAQFWAEGDCNILISLTADTQMAFFRGLAYGVDSFVMGNSRDFDTWKELNPSGFVYGQANDAYLEGESRAFVDADSMENVYEDRSRMIACAMMEGNKNVFSSQIMQKKLLRICMGIREAYGLEKSKDTYFWEQYLNQSLAYTK